MKSLLLLITSALCLFGQVDTNSMQMRYGPPVEETFSVRPGITLSVIYGDSHQVCKLDLRSSRNDSVPAALIEELVNEIVPLFTRGTPGPQFVACTGLCWKMTEYERMRIGQAVNDVRQSSHPQTQAQNSLAVVQFKSCEAVKQ